MDKVRDKADGRSQVLDHFRLIREKAAGYRNSRRILLRRHLKELRERIQKGLENGEDPLNIFPKEIWTMILGHVTEQEDLYNCSKTCKLFQEILEGTKMERLFAKTFPLISAFLREDDIDFPEDVGSCRLVCKKWCLTIDRFLETNFPIQSKFSTRAPTDKGFAQALEEEPNVFFENETIPQLHYCRLPGDPAADPPSRFQETSPFRESMRLHPRNPILGGSVAVIARSPDFDGQPSFQMELSNFLNDFGRHIFYLELSSDDDHEYDSPQEYHSTVVQCLSKCPNLKGLRLFGEMRQTNWNCSTGETAELEIADHASLESLTTYHSCGSSFENQLFQDRLLEKFSGQLKFLEVHSWRSEIYPALPWNNLCRLFIDCMITNRMLESLEEISAPNLHTLTISLASCRPELKRMLELVTKFPNLGKLQLRIVSGGGQLGQDEIIRVPPQLTCQNSLTTLSITLFVPPESISYDFLICFPFIKRLILYFQSEEEVEESADDDGQDSEDELESGMENDEEAGPDSSDEPESVQSDSTSPCSSPGGRPTAIKENVVDIAKYLWKDVNDKEQVEQMYKSNVWEILPFLQRFEVWTEVVMDGITDPVRRVYTRQGYDWRDFGKNEKSSLDVDLQ